MLYKLVTLLGPLQRVNLPSGTFLVFFQAALGGLIPRSALSLPRAPAQPRELCACPVRLSLVGSPSLAVPASPVRESAPQCSNVNFGAPQPRNNTHLPTLRSPTHALPRLPSFALTSEVGRSTKTPRFYHHSHDSASSLALAASGTRLGA